MLPVLTRGHRSNFIRDVFDKERFLPTHCKIPQLFFLSIHSTQLSYSLILWLVIYANGRHLCQLFYYTVLKWKQTNFKLVELEFIKKSKKDFFFTTFLFRIIFQLIWENESIPEGYFNKGPFSQLSDTIQHHSNKNYCLTVCLMN